MLSVLFVWLICGFTFLVFGKLLIDTCNFFMGEKSSYGIAATFFLGIALVGTLLSFISLWAPVNSFTGCMFFFFAVICTLLLYVGKKDLFWKDWFNKVKQTPLSTKWMIVTVAVIVIFSNLSPPFLSDMKLYYQQTILWNESYRVIPGLGNIHGRFGFNSNILLLSSAFSFHNIFSVRIYAILTLSIFVLIGWILTKADSFKTFLPKIGLVFLCFLFVLGYQYFLSSPSTDLLPNIIVLFILLNAVFDSKSYTNNPLLYSVLAIYALTLKLSVVPVCLFFVYIIITQFKEKNYRPVVLLVIFSFITILPWLIRNVIITGYLIYPFPSIDIFSFDWKIPEALAVEEKDWVSSWARMPGLSVDEYRAMPDGEWLKFWLLRHIRGMHLFLFVYFLAAVSPLIMFILKKKKVISSFAEILPWLVAFCGFIFWFVLAPDARFGLSFIGATAIIPFLYMKVSFISKYRNIVYKGLFYGLFFYLIINISDIFFKVKDDSKDILSYLYLPEDVRYVTEKDKTQFKVMKVGNIDVYIPNNMLCSDHPIPCAPYMNNNLEMRGEVIEDGFRIKQN